MLPAIRTMTLAAAVMLPWLPMARSQDKANPAPAEQTGLKVGAKAPKFTLEDQEDEERSQDEFLGKGKRVALMLCRSADW